MSNEYADRCGTKAKRAALAAELQAKAKEWDVDCAIEVGSKGGYPDEHETRFVIWFGPYRVSGGFDGSAGGKRVGAFLGHWHTELGSGAKYPKTFGHTIGGTINQYHYAKATTCKNGWLGFLYSLQAGFVALKELEPAA